MQKHTHTKNKKHGVHFALAWVWSLPWSVCESSPYTQGTLPWWRGNYFPSPSKNKLQIILPFWPGLLGPGGQSHWTWALLDQTLIKKIP